MAKREALRLLTPRKGDIRVRCRAGGGFSWHKVCRLSARPAPPPTCPLQVRAMRADPVRALLCLLPLLAGCMAGPAPDTAVVEGPWNEPALAPDALERGRLDPSWREVVQLDSMAMADTAHNPERWEQISVNAVNRSATFLPISGDAAGPSVLRVQVLLDRALFSPGVMDGRGERTRRKPFTGCRSGKAFLRRASWTRQPSRGSPDLRVKWSGPTP
jgi:hypothetical protein